jgi:hypothetical protein
VAAVDDVRGRRDIVAIGGAPEEELLLDVAGGGEGWLVAKKV